MFEKYVPQDTKVVGLLFSASYCKWCEEFMPLMKSLYPHLSNIEILFVGSDKTADAFDQYKSDHPWAVIPYEDPLRVRVRDLYGIKTIPALVFVKPDGSMIEPNGRIILPSLMKDLPPMIVAKELRMRFGIDTDIAYNSDDSDW